MKSAGKARSNGLYRHIRTSKEIIRNLLNDYYEKLKKGSQSIPVVLSRKFNKMCIAETRKPCYTVREIGNAVDFRR